MKDIRDKLKVLNVGKGKDNRIKAKTTNGVIQVQNRMGLYEKIFTISQFNNLYNL